VDGEGTVRASNIRLYAVGRIVEIGGIAGRSKIAAVVDGKGLFEAVVRAKIAYCAESAPLLPT